MRYVIAVYPYGSTVGNGDADFVEFEGDLTNAEPFIKAWWQESHEETSIAWTAMPKDQLVCYRLKRRAPDPMEKYEKVK